MQKDTPDVLILIALVRAKSRESISKVMPGQYIHRKEMYLMGLMSIVAGTTDERDIGNVIKELPVTDEIKNGLLGAKGLFGEVFRMIVDDEHANWDKVEEFVEKYNVDAQQLACEYVQCVRFMQQFYIG